MGIKIYYALSSSFKDTKLIKNFIKCKFWQSCFKIILECESSYLKKSNDDTLFNFLLNWLSNLNIATQKNGYLMHHNFYFSLDIGD